jgi:hypothetical protein
MFLTLRNKFSSIKATLSLLAPSLCYFLSSRKCVFCARSCCQQQLQSKSPTTAKATPENTSRVRAREDSYSTEQQHIIMSMLLQKRTKAVPTGLNSLSSKLAHTNSDCSKMASPCALPAALCNSSLEQLLAAKSKHTTQVRTLCFESAQIA